tara:strand:- start:129 stop:572 length:444 start_codon:yes stop_codon:yes gene_type:complete
MKNNTKLIMETWRRYLKEGPQDEEMDINRPFDFSRGEFVEEDMPQDGSEPQDDEPEFIHNDPPPADDFDRVTQGPEKYVADEVTIKAIVDMLNNRPHLSPEDIKDELNTRDIDEEIEIAKERYANSQMTSGEENEFGEIYDPAGYMY